MIHPKSFPAPTPRKVDRTSRPIDLVHLARQTLGDRSLQDEVLRMFDGQISHYFDRVRRTEDRHELSMGLHTLKGASAGVGAVALAELARLAEQQVRETGTVDPEMLDDIGMAVSEVSAYIQTLIQD